MTTNRLDALAALEAFILSLGPKPPPGCEFPSWLDQRVGAVVAHTVRGRLCVIYALRQPQDGVTGFVLDTVGNVAYEVRDGNLAAALQQVGRGPKPGLKRPWRQWNGGKR